MKCAFHPKQETTLRCASCDRPICFKCQVVTQVGIKCRECAAPIRMAGRHSRPMHYLRATGAGLATAVVGGLAYAELARMIPFFGFILGFFLGYVIAQAVLWGGYRAHGRTYQFIALACVAIAFGAAVLYQGHLSLGILAAAFMAWVQLA